MRYGLTAGLTIMVIGIGGLAWCCWLDLHGEDVAGAFVFGLAFAYLLVGFTAIAGTMAFDELNRADSADRQTVGAAGRHLSRREVLNG